MFAYSIVAVMRPIRAESLKGHSALTASDGVVVMEYIYAAMLLHKAGKEINEENLSRVLEAAGINPDPVRVKSLVAALKEIDIDEAIKATSIGMPMPGTAAPPPPGPTPAEEEAKEA